MRQKTLGIIGGLGPVATAHFMELVIRMTKAQTDQEHIDMVIFHTPTVPDRTAYILDHSKPNPVPKMIELGHKLAEEQADVIAIPCFTAHSFYEELSRNIPVPIVNGPLETARYLQAHHVKKAGIMATDGTIRQGLFHKALESCGIEPVVPSEQGQKNVMSLIYDDVKWGRPAEMPKFRQVTEELRKKGAEVIILGCTELSMIKRDEEIGPGFLDAMEVLAMRSVVSCGKELNEEFQNLITK